MSVVAAEPKKSRILLVGTPECDDPGLSAVPQITRNLIDLGSVLTDPDLGGFDIAHCVAAPSGADYPTVTGLLYDAAAAAQDLLLFYYSGHGLLSPANELYLSLRASRRDRLVGTALSIEDVRRVFHGSAARNKAMIIDSCYSGRAIGAALAGDDALIGQLAMEGTFTLASAHRNSPALVRSGEEHTAFTGRMLRVLREGSAQAGEMLTFRDIYHLVGRQLRADGLPAPQQCVTATIDMLGLVRNHAFAKPAPRPWRPAAEVPGEDVAVGEDGEDGGAMAVAARVATDSGPATYSDVGPTRGSHVWPESGSVPVERIRTAEALAGTMTDPAWAAYALAITAWAAAGDGDLGRANHLIDRGLTVLDGGGAPRAEPGPLAALARAAAAADGIVEARRLATRAEAALSATLLNQDPTLIGLVVRAAAEAGDAMQVRRLLDRAEQPGHATPVGALLQRTTAARAAAVAGEATRARQLTDAAEVLAAESLRQPLPLLPGHSSIFLVSTAILSAAELSRAAAACADSARARRLLDQARRSFDASTAPAVRFMHTLKSRGQPRRQPDVVHAEGLYGLVVATLSLAAAATELGAADCARKAADQARQDSQRIRFPLARAWALSYAAQATALIGETAAAQDMAEAIADDGPRQTALVSIVAALVAWPH